MSLEWTVDSLDKMINMFLYDETPSLELARYNQSILLSNNVDWFCYWLHTNCTQKNLISRNSIVILQLFCM